MVQQAINQVLTSIYKCKFSCNSFGFRPKRGCHDALRKAQRIVNEGNKYVVDLERFFDTVNHSRLIEIPGRTINDGRLVSLIHKEKTVVSYVRGVKYLGYSFYFSKGKCELCVHPKAKAKMKTKLKELTSRSNGMGYERRKHKLKEYIRGWTGYYHLANMKRVLLETDEWLCRRIRMCIWKS